MLMCNGVILNTTNPKTELDKEVAASMKSLASKYNLGKGGGRMLFTYPHHLIKPDRDNPGRFTKPAGMKISFRANQSMSDGSGLREWRYFITQTKNKSGQVSYSPLFHIFDGRWELGLSDIELIYFLLELYPLTEGGKNQDKAANPIIRRADAKADAKAEVERRRNLISIEAKLYLPESDGGFSEDEIRGLAARLMIAGSKDQDISLLIIEIDNKLKVDRSLVEKAKESSVRKDPAFEVGAIIAKAMDAGIIKLAKDGSGKLGWAINKDGAWASFYKLPVAAKDERSALVKYLIKNVSALDTLQLVLEKAAGTPDEIGETGDGNEDAE